MGKDQKKSGFLSSNWMTIVLIIVLIILAVVLILIIKSPQQFDMFKGCGKKKDTKPILIPVGWNLQSDSLLAENGLEIADELSWQKPLS